MVAESGKPLILEIFDNSGINSCELDSGNGSEHPATPESFLEAPYEKSDDESDKPKEK